MTLHLVRHLPVDPRHAGVCHGWSDFPAADNPALEHAALARLRALDADRIVTSDLVRCLFLARRIAGGDGRVAPDASWRERHFGDWEGRRWDDIHAGDPAGIDQLMRPEYAPPGGETLLDVADRVAAALKAIDRSRRTLVVAHGGSIAVARCLCAGLPLDKAAPLIPRPGEIVSLNV